MPTWKDRNGNEYVIQILGEQALNLEAEAEDINLLANPVVVLNTIRSPGKLRHQIRMAAVVTGTADSDLIRGINGATAVTLRAALEEAVLSFFQDQSEHQYLLDVLVKLEEQVKRRRDASLQDELWLRDSAGETSSGNGPEILEWTPDPGVSETSNCSSGDAVEVSGTILPA